MDTNIGWPKTDDINLVQAFILADRIHQWVSANEDHTEINFLTLACVAGECSDEKWAASFDSLKDEEWFESMAEYSFAAYGSCPEEAMYRAAMKVKDRIEKIESKGD